MNSQNISSIGNRLDEAARARNLSLIFLFKAIVIIFIVSYLGFAREWFVSSIIGLALLPTIFVLISSAASYLLASFQYKAELEEEEAILLQKRKEKTALEIGEDVLFVARRARDNYLKFAPYIVSVIKIVVSLSFLIIYYQKVYKAVLKDFPARADFAPAAFVSAALAISSLFFGVFVVGESRQKSCRWLRVPGAWLIFSFAIFAASSVSILLIKSGRGQYDLPIRNIFLIVLCVITVELFLNFVMEFYRPRGEMEERPVFESRILSLFTEPGGVMRNIAETLDYQFGFKISGTWLYKTIETSLIPIILLWAASLWMMTGVVQVYPNELGFRESFGIVEKENVLSAGIHFKLPFPFGNIIRIPADDVQEIFVGTGEPEDKETSNSKAKKSNDAILWTVSHYEKEKNFLVAAEKAVSETEVPVSFISSIFNVQYKISRKFLYDYYYLNRDIRPMIQSISESVIIKFLAGKDMLKMLSLERKSNKELLAKILQKAYDEHNLGIEVLFVNILDVHPPVEKVAPSFQDVVGAMEEKEAEILKAKAYENQTLPMAEAEAAKLVLEAEIGSKNAVTLARSENERFSKQMLAYRQMPDMFKLRTYLDFFETDLAKVRKIVIDSNIPYNVFILNFEEKQRLDLIDVPLSDIAPTKK